MALMASGFWLGGAAEGIQSANKQMLAERTLEQDVALRSRGHDLTSRGLDIQERSQKRLENQSDIERVDKQVAATMSSVADLIRNGLAANRDAQTILKTVQPIVDSVKVIAQRAGTSPESLDAQVQAMIGQPGLTETATATGTASAVKTAAQERALTAAGVSPNRFETHDKRVSAENALRDDYTAQSKDFITIRNAKNRMDSLDFKSNPGAADLALVFDYLKILDPNSTVREGEFKTASEIAGLPGVIESLRNRILGQGQLNDPARQQILGQASKLYQSQARQHDKLTTQFANIAKRQGLNVDNVIVDQAPPAGWQTTPNGTRFRVDDPLGIRGNVPPPPAGFQVVP
jgi:hypothetical protein